MFERPIDRENEYDADFALGDEVESDELEDDPVDLELLDARVQAARLAGA